MVGIIIVWVIAVHIFELAGVGIYLLIRKNTALENTIIAQQQYIDAVSIRISDAQEKLEGLDTLGAFKADDEVGFFFQNLAEIQKDLNQFAASKQ